MLSVYYVCSLLTIFFTPRRIGRVGWGRYLTSFLLVQHNITAFLHLYFCRFFSGGLTIPFMRRERGEGEDGQKRERREAGRRKKAGCCV